MDNQQETFTRKKQILLQNWIQEPVVWTAFREKLKKFTRGDDLDMLLKNFTTLGICLATENTQYEREISIQYLPLYKKIAVVLKSGERVKLKVALNLIIALLHLEDNPVKKNYLSIYCKNMIRVNGCLAIMTELFTSEVEQLNIWEDLCRSISETCDGSAPNQAYCSHLIPMCIKQCQKENLYPILILRGLVSNNQDNVKLFHENKGMSMFDRVPLQNPASLQVLNSIVENTKPEYLDELKASHIFAELRFFLNRYGPNSTIGAWACVILFSLNKENIKNHCGLGKCMSPKVLHIICTENL